MPVRVSVIQEHLTAIPAHPDETAEPEILRQQIEVFKESFMAPQMALAQEALAMQAMQPGDWLCRSVVSLREEGAKQQPVT